MFDNPQVMITTLEVEDSQDLFDKAKYLKAEIEWFESIDKSSNKDRFMLQDLRDELASMRDRLHDSGVNDEVYLQRFFGE